MLTNILLTEDMEPKLSDFGLAKTLQMEETKVFTYVGGTIGYMDTEYITHSKLTCVQVISTALAWLCCSFCQEERSSNLTLFHAILSPRRPKMHRPSASPRRQSPRRRSSHWLRRRLVPILERPVEI
ncbi:hypothetical protein VPH35_099379 [Triticum aestivum]